MSGQLVATNFFFIFFLSNQFLVRNNFDKIAFNSLLFFSLKLIYVYLIICIVVCFVSISKETQILSFLLTCILLGHFFIPLTVEVLH